MNLIEAARNLWQTIFDGERGTGRKYHDDVNSLERALAALPSDAVIVSRALLEECVLWIEDRKSLIGTGPGGKILKRSKTADALWEIIDATTPTRGPNTSKAKP